MPEILREIEYCIAFKGHEIQALLDRRFLLYQTFSATVHILNSYFRPVLFSPFYTLQLPVHVFCPF